MKNLIYSLKLSLTVFILLLFAAQASAQVPLFSAVPVSNGGTPNSIGQANDSRNISINAQGTIGVAYIGSDGLRFAKSVNGGQSFLPSVQLSTATTGDVEVNVADNGTIYVAYSDGSQMYLFVSFDGGATFTGPSLIGNGIAPHIASYGSNVYIVPQNGSAIYSNTNNGIGAFTSVSLGTWIFADIQVDKSNGDVYFLADDPSIDIFKSTNSGASFTQVPLAGAPSVFFSSYTLSSGPAGNFVYVGGSTTNGRRINFGNGTNANINLGNNMVQQGRTMASDGFGNVIDGFAASLNSVAFRVSTNQGTTFGLPVIIAGATTHNISRNPATGDIVVVYQTTGGEILVNVYANLLPGLTVSGVAQSYCPSNSGTVSFRAVGKIFNPGNQFIAQLSDANGSFASPVNIGSINSVASSGTIAFTIPAGTLSGTNYRIRVVSTNNAFTGSDNGFGISINPTPIANIMGSGPLTFCQGNSVMLVAAGAPSGSTFLWNTNETTPAITATQSGTYSVTVTNACGLAATSAPVSVSVLPAPDATINASGPLQFCAGGSVTLSVASGAGLVYQWQKDGIDIAGATGTSITATESGEYSVSISSPNGCSSASTATVTVNDLPSVAVSATPSTIVVGNSSTLSANVFSTRVYTVALSDLVNTGNDCGSGSRYGFSNQGFNWNDNGAGVVTNVQIQFSIGVECHTGGTVHATAINGVAGPSYTQTQEWCSCSDPSPEQIVTLDFANPSGYTVGGTNTFAVTDASTALGFYPAAALNGAYAIITVTYNTAANNLTYNWAPGNLSGNPVAVSPQTTTTYTLTVTNAQGCSSNVSTTVTVITFALSKTNTSCPNGNDGTITVSTTNANGPIEYSLNNSPFVSNNVFTGLTAGNYSVRIRSGAAVSSPQNITVLSNPDNTPPTVVTKDINIQLNPATGTATITPNQVDNGSSDFCGIASYSVSPSTFDCTKVGPNTVTLTVTDVNGNVATGTAVVNVVGLVTSCSITATPSGTIIGSSNSGAGVNQILLGYGYQSMTLNTSATGTGPFTYSWSGPNLSTTTGSQTVFTPTAGGMYTITNTVTGAFGCKTTCSITICVLDVRSTNGNNKVLLCHVPPGNPSKAKTLSISANAVQAHLSNHDDDRLGACPMTCGATKSSGREEAELFIEETVDGMVELTVYPNPSNATFTFQLESPADENMSITIFDLSGRIVAESKDLPAGEKAEIGNDLMPGVYMAEVKQGDFHRIVKITKLN